MTVHRKGVPNRGQRNEQELERSSLADGRGDGCPGGVGQSQAAPQCDIGIALEVSGTCHCNKDRQEGERSPGDHVIDLVCACAGDINKQTNNDQNTLQKTCSCQYIYEWGDTAGHHCDDTVDQAFFNFRGFLGESHHTCQMLVYILGMGADDNLILSACLNNLDNSRHLLNFLCHGFVFNIGSKLSIITNLFCHVINSSFCVLLSLGMANPKRRQINDSRHRIVNIILVEWFIIFIISSNEKNKSRFWRLVLYR